MNPPFTLLLGAVFLLSAAVSAQSNPFRFSAQPYAHVSIEGWSLLDGGAGSGERAMALLDLGADFKLAEKLEGHVGGFVYAGDRDVDSFTGDFGVFSNILTESRYILYTAWLKHSFDDSYIRFGQLASDESFYVSEGGSLFLNSNFGAIPSVSANVAAPIFSVGSAGIEYWKQLDNGYYQLGAYAGDSGPGDRKDHGFKWNAGGIAGYFLIAEKGWNYGSIGKAEGQFKTGAYFHSGKFESFATGSGSNGNGAIYAIVDQPVSESINLFARVGFNPKSEYSVVDRYLDIGINWMGIVDSRPDDVFGIAYSKTRFSNEYRNSVALNENQTILSEYVFEITYAAEIAEGCQVQPSIQYIINPFYASKDTIVAGIRLSKGF